MSEFGVELPEQTEFDLSDSEYLEADVQSVSIEEYWHTLEKIDSSYKSIKQVVQNAHDDLQWYKSKLDDAEKLCMNKRLRSINSIKETKTLSSLPKKISHDVMNSALSEINRKVDLLDSKNKERNSVIQELERNSQETLDVLNTSIKNIRERIDAIKAELKINQEKILLHSSQVDQIKSRILTFKTTRMQYTVALCSIFIIIFLATKNIILALTTTFFAFLIF